MDLFFIEFRDPLFGIIVFFVLVFIITFFSYWWGRFKSKEEHRQLDRFIRDFHHLPPQEELTELIESSTMSEKSWMLLAHAYSQNGDFEKAIEVYQAVAHKQQDLHLRNNTLFLLGKTYFKAGFLERAKSLFLEILSRSPRTSQALRYLLLVYEQLHQYNNALEVLDPLDELNSTTHLDRLYLECISIINDPVMETDEKCHQLLKLYARYHVLTYMIFEYLFRNQPKLGWQHLDQSQAQRLGDILWRLDENACDLGIISQNSYLRELFTARGVADLAEQSTVFELDILIKLRRGNQSGATLNFEYLCRNCKHVLPFPFHRCPNCYAIDTISSQPTLSRDYSEENLSFQ